MEIRKKIVLISILLVCCNIPFAQGVRDLNEIKESGVIKVGLRKSPTVYIENDKTGEIDGYVWNLVLAWAESIGVEAEPVFLDTMTDYWELDGKIPVNLIIDESLIYTPDIYKEIDLAADIFARLPWRERLVDMHKYIDTGSILVARKDANVSTPNDLIGKRIYVVKDQSGYNLVLDLLERNELKYNEISVNYYLDDNGLSILDYAGKEGDVSSSFVNLIAPIRSERNIRFKPMAIYHWLLNDQVDLLINNSLTFFIYNQQNSSLRRYLEPALPVSNNLISVCLASSKETPELSKNIDDFLKKSQENGINDTLLKKYAGISLKEYNQLLGKE